MENKKNILIVDDSALMRRVISDIILSDNRFTVKDTATNGLNALELLMKNAKEYDLMLLDVNMPKMTGLELLTKLQENHISIKTIMVSTMVKEGTKETILALERGAFDFITKPEDYLGVKDNRFKVKLLSGVCVALGMKYSDNNDADNRKSYRAEEKEYSKMSLSSENKDKSNHLSTSIKYIPVRPPKNIRFARHKKYKGTKKGIKKLVAIASSTGGPKSLQSVITKLPKNLDAPVVIVQHMPKGFTTSLAMRLNELSEIEVKEARDGEVLRKGCVYIAPGGLQTRIQKEGNEYAFSIKEEPARDGLKPCANIMYESLIGSSFDEITCVVLTGMGADGTMGIGMLGEMNNVYVIAQDEESCVVYGMPKSIAEAHVVDQVVSLENVADAILKNVGC